MPRKSADEAPSNGAELAKLLNLTLPQCYNLANSGTIPRADNGTWNLAQCANAYIKYLQGRAGEEKRDYAVERTRLTKAQADKTELELKLLQADVIRASIIESVWGRMTAAARSRLMALPYRLAQVAIAASDFAEIEEQAAELIVEALNELHAYDPSDYMPHDSNAERVAVESAAETPNKRVGRPRKKAEQRGERGTRTVAH